MSRFERSRRAPLTRPGIGARRRNGQSLVEFAVVLPIFLLILCAILDFGALLYSQMTVINAAREGARAATLMAGESQGAIEARAGDRASAAAGGLDVHTDAACGACKAGNFVTVTVRYDHHLFFPLLFGTSIPTSSTVQMMLEETGTGGS
jgi:Flp pilus assembly protein TadG